MSILRSWRQALLLGACAVGATFIGANLFGQPGQPAVKTAVNRPKVAVAKHNILPPELQVDLGGKNPIPFKPIVLAELPLLNGKKVTADTVITHPDKKTIKVGDYLVALNKNEAELNKAGYSLRTGVPKGGIKTSLRAKTSAPTFAKQKEHVTSTHIKVAADQDARAKANIASHSKANLPTLAKDAKATDDKNTKTAAALINRFKKVDTKKMTADERKAFDHVHGLIITKTAPPNPGKRESHEVTATLIKKNLNQTLTLVRKTKFLDKNLEQLLHQAALSGDFDYVKTYHWDYGSSSAAEVHVDAKLAIGAHGGMLHSTAFTSCDVKAGGHILTHPFTILEAHAGLYWNTPHNGRGGSDINVYAKFFGHDIFTPIQSSGGGALDYKFVDKDYPFDVAICSGSVTYYGLTFPYDVRLTGGVHVKAGALVHANYVSTAPTVTVKANMVASGGVEGSKTKVYVKGTLNLVDDKLDLVGKAAFLYGTSGPYLDIQYSAHNYLAGLSGNVVVVAETYSPVHLKDLFVNPTWHEAAHGTLFSWPGMSSSGYVINPTHKTISLQ